MTSGRSGLRLLRPGHGRFTSWCGSCAKARKSLGIRAGRSLYAQNQFGRRNCADARWCRSLGHLDHSAASRHASCRTDRSVADHDRRKAAACCPLSRFLPGVQLSARPCWRVKPEHGSSSRGVQVMLNSAAIARPFRVSEMYRDPCRVDDAGPKVVQFLDGVRDQNANPTSPLNRYIEGWAQTDLEKILDGSRTSWESTHYRFCR